MNNYIILSSKWPLQNKAPSFRLKCPLCNEEFTCVPPLVKYPEVHCKFCESVSIIPTTGLQSNIDIDDIHTSELIDIEDILKGLQNDTLGNFSSTKME